MVSLNNIKDKVNQMSKLALSMWHLTYDAFIKHDLDLITKALDEENKLNSLLDEVSASIVNLVKVAIPEEEKVEILVYVDIANDLELIGDYCKDILERIQMKIEEKLLFSEDAVSEYKELYAKTNTALEEVVFVLEKDNPALVKEVLRKEEHLDSLVDEYRAHQNQRMVHGICTTLGCNMYLNMLDFTAAIYYHIKKIARSLLKIK